MTSHGPGGNPAIEPGTVEVLLDTVRGLVAAENARESFNSRGSGVAGFAGIVVFGLSSR